MSENGARQPPRSRKRLKAQVDERFGEKGWGKGKEAFPSESTYPTIRSSWVRSTEAIRSTASSFLAESREWRDGGGSPARPSKSTKRWASASDDDDGGEDKDDDAEDDDDDDDGNFTG